MSTKPSSIEDYFKIHKVVLKTVGISLYDNDSRLYRYYSYFSIAITVVLYTLLESYGIYKFYGDLDEFASFVTVSAAHWIGLVKVLVLLKNRPLIKKTLKVLEEGIFAPNMKRGGSFEMEQIVKCVTSTRTHSMVYWTPIALAAIISALTPIVTRISSNDYRDWKTPFVKFSVFELKKSPDFEIVSLMQTVCLINFAYIISTTDLIIVSVIAHLKTQFIILTNAFGRVIDDARTNAQKNGIKIEDNSSIPPVFLRKSLRKVIIYHQSIINIANQFEELFNFLILSLFVINTLILCFSMYHASLYSVGDPKFAKPCLFFATVSFQVFLYCYWGNELSDESQKVATGCYNIEFTGTYSQFQKDLGFIIMRCQKPVVLTAGKFTNLSLLTFLGIMRMSYSYFVVLKQTNEINTE